MASIVCRRSSSVLPRIKFTLGSRACRSLSTVCVASNAARIPVLQTTDSICKKLTPLERLEGRRTIKQKSKLTKEVIEQRVLNVCKAYDKITADKLTLEAHFINDLGLDSLDHVEIIMAIEDEFYFEIPDADAERLMRPADIVRYVGDHEDIYE